MIRPPHFRVNVIMRRLLGYLLYILLLTGLFWLAAFVRDLY